MKMTRNNLIKKETITFGYGEIQHLERMFSNLKIGYNSGVDWNYDVYIIGNYYITTGHREPFKTDKILEEKKEAILEVEKLLEKLSRNYKISWQKKEAIRKELKEKVIKKLFLKEE